MFAFYSQYIPGHRTIDPRLLWEYDVRTFDWERGAPIVAARVVELGWPEDWFAAFDIYGGLEGFREKIKQAAYLSEKNMAFVCTVFDLKKEELECYKRTQLRQKRFGCSAG